MKILVVHDRQEVAERIRQIIDGSGVYQPSVDFAADYYTAKQHLADNIYDLLILDLTIPLSRHSGDPSYEYVNQLLYELFNMETLNPPQDVIGITRDLSALKLVDSQIGPHLMVAIEESADGSWEQSLRDKILYSDRSSRTRTISINRHYDVDLLVVTAMDAEARSYVQCFDLRPIKHFEGAKEFGFTDRRGGTRKGVIYSIGRSGQPSAASWTQSLITCFRPQVAVMSGYCGGVRGKVALGDVILCEAAYAWDYGKWEEEGTPAKPVFRSRPNPISIEGDPLHLLARNLVQSDFNRSPRLLDKLREQSFGKLDSFVLRLTPMASGSAVVTNESIVAQIRGLHDLIWAVDMEAYGFYHAAKNTRVIKPDFICVKSVSDFCNGEKGDDLHQACSFLSAQVILDIVTQHWEFR